MDFTLDILEATKEIVHFIERKNGAIKILQVKPNTVKTIRADFMAFVDQGNNTIGVLFISRVTKNDLLNYNSQYDKNFISYYRVNNEICITKSFSKSLNKYIIMNARNTINKGKL